MAERILIIGAKDSADIATTAAIVVRRYREHCQREGRPLGLRGMIAFAVEGVPGNVVVWRSATQITVRFCDV